MRKYAEFCDIFMALFQALWLLPFLREIRGSTHQLWHQRVPSRPLKVALGPVGSVDLGNYFFSLTRHLMLPLNKTSSKLICQPSEMIVVAQKVVLIIWMTGRLS